MNRKKILCILQLPPPIHGASLMNSYVINSELLRKNFDIDIINLQFATSIKELEKFSIRKVFKAFFFGFEIIKRVLINRPNLVYFTLAPKGFAFYRDAFYVFLLKSLKRKIVFHLHGKGINKNALNNFFKKKIYTCVFKNTNVICLSDGLAKDISEVYNSIPYIVPNGIQNFPHDNKTLNKLNVSIPQILYLSNYVTEKGILVLIEALSILNCQGFNFKARFVGAPSKLSVEMLDKIIENQNLAGCINITGPLYGNDKIAEFQKADIFVFPTFYKNEAFPLVILEALHFELPVISTFEGGIPEIIVDGETGFLVETQNAQMLAEKIAILLLNKNMRIEMGKKGYERFIDNYTINHFENNMNNIFQTILDS